MAAGSSDDREQKEVSRFGTAAVAVSVRDINPVSEITKWTLPYPPSIRLTLHSVSVRNS